MKIIIGGDFYIPAEKAGLALQNLNNTWGQVLELLKQVDYRIINLEGPITEATDPIHKTGPHLKLNPELVELLKFAGIDLVTLANNHIKDHGEKGVTDSINHCRSIGIETVGAGSNLEHARSVKYIQHEDTRIAIINIAENEWNEATYMYAGSNPMDIVDNVKSIQEAKQRADFVLLIIHGGHELCKYPSSRMVKQYRFYARQGASAIISHHSHNISGYEVYEGVPIFYGLGNLIMPIKSGDVAWETGMLVQLEIQKDHLLDFRYFPYRFSENEFTLKLLTGYDLKVFKDEIQLINSALVNELILTKNFNECLIGKDEFYLASIFLRPFFRNKWVYKVLKITRLTNLFYSKDQLSSLLNHVRNESHREVLVEVLKERVYE